MSTEAGNFFHWTDGRLMGKNLRRGCTGDALCIRGIYLETKLPSIRPHPRSNVSAEQVNTWTDGVLHPSAEGYKVLRQPNPDRIHDKRSATLYILMAEGKFSFGRAI